ncbi:hypothetical protein P170DRAFT_493903 [Aspergillus steynii IBT 23096]|uniref:Zn(2)-C6 fungal-type domain-containing protein n=1 Tax=Aspergillus steynii IBT 23096 TaxID=1392250 RepID=A0A2I2G6T5_9EURO|nr:uncharacterized protein P170DRAFT_493903 [Aspergillus steynii IBT 23096]PLB48583.1 hypothetical protein P170DRAFT_493903 [Aspergillus steynii IBT 23096]
MNSSARRPPKSCLRCRDHHLRCDGAIPCESCCKARAKCEPTTSTYRFRSAPRHKRTYEFSPGQQWVNSKAPGRLAYVDMTPGLHQKQKQKSQSSSPLPGDGPGGQESTRSYTQHEVFESTSGQHVENQTIVHQEPGQLRSNPRDGNPTPRNSRPPDSMTPEALSIPSNRMSKAPLYDLPSSNSEISYLSLEEACLIRHFAENLAPWFDTSDRDRHFALFVPERAMHCPVLRYAVFTASAGHLTRLACCRGQATDEINFNGIPMPALTPDAAIRYHDICISHLIEISRDPAEEYNEDVLTAATILRFYEQIDDPMIGNSDTYLNAIQFIVNTQQNESFYAYQTIQGPLRDPDVHAMPSASLRHSACLSILRQEIWNAFLNRRPFRFPVSRENNYDIADIANDFVWTNRVMVWVADLLIFCFGKYPLMGFEERMERWTILKSVEQRWDTSKPPAFKPIFYRDRDASSGKHFPEIWHMNACQVAGAQHVELGRILLATSDPRQSSAFGINAVSRTYGLAAELRTITRRLCGLAVSNGKCPAASVTAMVGISICGEYFTDSEEQQAIVRLLNELEYDHAWPTARTVGQLRRAWEQTS